MSGSTCTSPWAVRLGSVPLLFHLCLVDALLDAGEEFTGTVSYHSEELAAAKPVISDSNSTVPDADDDHDVADVHLLQHGEKLVTRAIFTIVVESFSKDLFLLDGVQLADPVGQNAILSRCKL